VSLLPLVGPYIYLCKICYFSMKHIMLRGGFIRILLGSSLVRFFQNVTVHICLLVYGKWDGMLAEDGLFGILVIRKQIEMKYFVRVRLWIGSGWRTTQGSLYRESAHVSDCWGVF
jgi:hypothetical protein